MKEWDSRVQKAESLLIKRNWEKADKVARKAGEAIINGSLLTHDIEVLLARVSAVRAVSFAMRDQTRMAEWHWQVSQIIYSKHSTLDLSKFGKKAEALEDVRPRSRSNPAAGLLDWEDVGSPEIAVLSAPHPIYSEECRRHGIQSEVYVEVVLGNDGRIYEPVVYKLYDLAVFYYPILVAMADWEFEPHIVDGNPVTFTYKLTFSFSVP